MFRYRWRMWRVTKRISQLDAIAPQAGRDAGPLLVELEELRTEELWILNQWRLSHGGPPYIDAPKTSSWPRTVPWFARSTSRND